MQKPYILLLLPALLSLTPLAASAQVATGESHSCAILDGGSVKCWGRNLYGELGQGDTEKRGDKPGRMGSNLPAVNLGTGRTATAIAAGYGHTCAILDDGSIRCWGWNITGQLGLGDTDGRGDAPGEMGDALPAVNVGTGRTARAIAAGRSHTCALLDDGTIKCWGFNNLGQLGLGDGGIRGTEPGQMGDALPAVDLGTGRTATAVATGTDHTCALLDDGSVKCWGHNAHGQLGLGDTDNRGDEPGQMGNALPAVDLGSGRTAVQIATGKEHTCALLDDASIKCWGANSGQLGRGDTDDRGDEPGEMGDALPTVDLGTGRTSRLVSAGGSHTCAALDDRSVKCWGRNGHGQLGQGDIEERGGDSSEMGNNLPAVDLGGKVRVGVEDEAEVPGDDLALTARATAHGSITGRFTARGGETTRLGLYDLMGRRLAEQHVAGDFEIGSDLASGLYLLRVETGAQAVTRSVVVVR